MALQPNFVLLQLGNFYFFLQFSVILLLPLCYFFHFKNVPDFKIKRCWEPWKLQAVPHGYYLACDIWLCFIISSFHYTKNNIACCLVAVKVATTPPNMLRSAIITYYCVIIENYVCQGTWTWVVSIALRLCTSLCLTEARNVMLWQIFMSNLETHVQRAHGVFLRLLVLLFHS